jgi:hypothetical protein
MNAISLLRDGSAAAVSGSESHSAGVASPLVAAFSAMSRLLSRSALEVRP